MKVTLRIAAVVAVCATPALANNSNSGAALNMVEDLRAGAGPAAPSVSGQDHRSASGWGNNGSALVSGEQVSRGH